MLRKKSLYNKRIKELRKKKKGALTADFLNRCLAEKLEPKGLRVELEPTIGNYDQEFIDTWYAKLKSFSLTLMKDFVNYCDKTILQTKQNIRKTETDLKNVRAKEEYF